MVRFALTSAEPGESRKRPSLADFGIVKSRDLNFGIFGIIFQSRDLLIGIPALPGLTSLIKQFVIRNLQVVTSNFPVVKFDVVLSFVSISPILNKKFRNHIRIIVSCFEKSIRTPVTPLRHSAHH
jgi:hypothetical protein